jgi:TonB family protein
MSHFLNLLVAAAALSLSLPAPAAGRGGARQTTAPATTQDGWKRYTYPGEEFSAEWPETPSVFETSRMISRLESESMRVFGLYSGGVVFFVYSYDRPRRHETPDYFARHYLGERGLTASRDTSLAGFEGREYQMRHPFGDPPTTLSGVARVFRATGHAYLVEAFSDSAGHEREVERFLDSLALSANPSGETVPPDEPVPPFKPSKQPPPGTVAGDAAVKLSPQPTPDGPFTPKEVTRKAVIVYKPEPGFTEEARRDNVTGAVRLRAVLSSTGRVTNIAVVNWLRDGLTEKAIQAARHILFFPAEKDGRAVSQYVVLEYSFNIY